ncbi:MAG: sugar phosphate isomerase/epimerase [Bryobacter sp.]|jgi:sugar phosphate isomerase/epimerase|nr:sugar phosphate isomerase/epimerase [Bryobacter sp. CoA8 C33]
MLLTLHGVILNGRAGWPEMAKLAHEAGFSGVEIPVGPALKEGAKKTREVLSANGVKPGVTSFPVEIRKDDATFERDLAQLGEAAELARAIGCPRMATWIPSSAENPKTEQRLLMLGRLRKVCGILARHGVRLGLEFLGPLHIRKRYAHEFIWKMPEMLEFARECGPNCGLLLDSWHWHHAGASGEDIVKAGKEAIVHVHLADAPDLEPEKILDNERLLPGEGVVKWKEFFQALKQIGYRDAVSPEVFGRGLKDMPLGEATRITREAAMKVMKQNGAA